MRMKGKLMLAALGAIVIGLGVWWYASSSEPDLLVEGCEKKVIAEVMGCGDPDDKESGCSYRFEDGSFDARESGHKKGDELEVCRGEAQETP